LVVERLISMCEIHIRMKIYFAGGSTLSIELVDGIVVGTVDKEGVKHTLKAKSLPEIEPFVDELGSIGGNFGFAAEFELLDAYAGDLITGKSVDWFPSDGVIGKDPCELKALVKLQNEDDWKLYSSESFCLEETPLEYKIWNCSSSDIEARDITFDYPMVIVICHECGDCVDSAYEKDVINTTHLCDKCAEK
jgi:hypothetical protein